MNSVVEFAGHVRLEKLFHVVGHVVVERATHLAHQGAHLTRAVGFAHAFKPIREFVDAIVLAAPSREAAHQLGNPRRTAMKTRDGVVARSHADERREPAAALFASKLEQGHAERVPLALGKSVH